MTKTTNLRVLNKADFLDAEVNIDSAVAKTMQITESIKGKNNDVVMEIGEVTHAARFPQHTVFENITINKGVIQNLTTSKTDFYFIGSGGAGIEGSFVRSGVFVVLYGTAHVSSLDTNKYMEIPMVEDVKNPVPDELLPKHYRVKTTTNGPGGRIFMFTFNTKGLMQIRNCGSKYETDTAVDVTFRFDYFLI